MPPFPRANFARFARSTMKFSLPRRGYQTVQEVNSLRSAWGHVRSHPNNGLKYLGLAGALGLGGYIAIAASRPATYVDSGTRANMAALGGHAYAQKIRSRIARTYGYLTGSVVLTAATSWILFTRGYGLRVLMMNPWMYGLGTMVAAWGAIWMTMSLSYQHNPMAKHAAWALTNGLIGFSLLGLSTLAGGLIVRQAAMITGCIVGSLSLAAMAAPNDTFLRMGPYLGVGLGVVIAASLGGMFFPASTLLYNVSLYGGLAVFGLYVAHDSQKVLHDAQVVPQFDPIGEQMGIYLDTINIFVRVVQILMMQQRKK